MELQKAFNKHFIEFVDDIAGYFSENMKIQTTANALRAMRKTNPRLVIEVWNNHIVKLYEDEIEKGDINFFITKDYNDDVACMAGNQEVLGAIDKIRKPIQEMDEEDQVKAMKYVQNLTKLCKLYYLNRN